MSFQLRALNARWKNQLYREAFVSKRSSFTDDILKWLRNQDAAFWSPFTQQSEDRRGGYYAWRRVRFPNSHFWPWGNCHSIRDCAYRFHLNIMTVITGGHCRGSPSAAWQADWFCGNFSNGAALSCDCSYEATFVQVSWARKSSSAEWGKCQAVVKSDTSRKLGGRCRAKYMDSFLLDLISMDFFVWTQLKKHFTHALPGL
jgi:hypothetical protein